MHAHKISRVDCMLDKIHKHEFMQNIFMEKYGTEDVCLVYQSAIGFKIILHYFFKY